MMTIKMISETEAQVTKAFAKKAVIFGTEEYKLWKAYREDFPNAQMVCKQIKKKVNKKVDTKNLTYENMRVFISISVGDEGVKELEKQIALSKIQKNPYRAVVAWFLKEYEGYDGYKDFFKNIEEERKEKEVA